MKVAGLCDVIIYEKTRTKKLDLSKAAFKFIEKLDKSIAYNGKQISKLMRIFVIDLCMFMQLNLYCFF